jgi:predicted NUDIX family phosphoesterase/dephospho-CoA kinase
MKKTFLEIAELILRDEKRPLNPNEIFSIAEHKGLLNSNGKTPSFSMKARISTDLRKNGFSSKFMRVGPNKFALREFGLKEFISQPFKKSIPKEIITCIEQSKLTSLTKQLGFSSDVLAISNVLKNENLRFIERKIAENDTGFKQLISYVLLTKDNDKILTYKRGVYTNAHEMIKGSTCLGFGGHVQDIDTNNIFSKGYAGVFDTAEREVFEELKGFKPENLSIAGYISDNSSPEGVKHLGVVLKGEIPANFDIKTFSKELSINDLKFMTIMDLWDKFHEFEFWSQLLIKHFFGFAEKKNPVIIRPIKYNIRSNIFVFIGEIACGKTILCEMLSKKNNDNLISTRKCVASLIDEFDFGTSNRKIFQEKAEQFIKSTDGPQKLAREIKNETEKYSGNIFIDGIRHFETLIELKKYFPDLTVIFIDSTRDDAFRNYCNRSNGTLNIDNFREERHHPVENEIKFLKGEASVYIFNGGTKEQLFDEFLKWFKTNRI